MSQSHTKTVLVTGGTIRLGKAISLALRARGWRVLTSSHRADSGADVIADLSKKGAAKRLFDAALALAGGRLDAIVNNAAMFTGDVAAMRAVNETAPQRLTELMARNAESLAAVVNVTDAETLVPQDSISPYLETKLNLTFATTADARRFAPLLRVNAVAPGSVLANRRLHLKSRPTLLDNRPTPEDVAAAVAFLLETPSVTNVVLPVDGGSIMGTVEKSNDERCLQSC